jgi:hypothetical protein
VLCVEVVQIFRSSIPNSRTLGTVALLDPIRPALGFLIRELTSALSVQRWKTLDVSADCVQSSHIGKLINKVLVHTRSLFGICTTDVIDDPEVQRGVHCERAVFIMTHATDTPVQDIMWEPVFSGELSVEMMVTTAASEFEVALEATLIYHA